MSSRTHALTIRGFDEELQDRLEQIANEQGISLNDLALSLLRKGVAGETFKKPATVGNSLDHLIGTWSAEEELEFLKAIEVFEQIDESLWS